MYQELRVQAKSCLRSTPRDTLLRSLEGLDPRRLRSLLSTPSLSPAPSHTHRHGYINALLVYHRAVYVWRSSLPITLSIIDNDAFLVQQVLERNSSCHHHIRLRSSSSGMLSLEVSSNQNATDKKASVHWLFFQRPWEFKGRE